MSNRLLFNYILKQYGLFIIYLIILCGLYYGVYTVSGTNYFGILSFYTFSFIVFYFVFIKILNKSRINEKIIEFKFPVKYNIILTVLLIISGITMILHLFELGYVPIIKALNSTKVSEVVNARRLASVLPNKITLYFSSFTIKAFMPFLLVYYLYKKKYYIYTMLLIVGGTYCIALMQKSFIITLLTPSIVYSFFSFRKIWYVFLSNILVVLIYIYTLLYVANPSLRNLELEVDNKIPIENIEKEDVIQNRNLRYVYAVFRRIFIVPGEMVAGWFTYIPEKKTYLKGCGYHFLTSILDCEFRDYSKELYPLIRPQYAKRGLKGSVNVAHFMYDYANFGKYGLILAGIIMAVILAFFDYLYNFNLIYKLSFNLFYVLMLSSSALTTLLFSGGWGIMLLLFLLFKKEFLKNE